jgi:hypothetical protein
MNKKLIFFLAIAVVISAVIIPLITHTMPGTPSMIGILAVATSSSVPTTIKAHAEWTSKAATIDALMLESDLVVRARVSAAPVTRVLRQELPVWDQNNKIVGSTILETLFSDTVFEGIKTYWGEPRSSITVAQTDRELYVIVNPFGRFRIEEENARSYGQAAMPGEFSTTFSVVELETQIEQLVRELKQ